MKISTILFLFVLTPFYLFSQQAYEVAEGKPYVINGIEYGFEIRNESKKDIKKEEFSRFEITAFVSNKSGCTKIMLPSRTLFGLDYQDVVAEFDCINATGKRLTSKSGKVKAREFTAPYTFTTKGADGKDIKNNVNVKVGNMLRNGETVRENFTVILQNGEQPKMKVRIIEMLD